MDEILKIKDLQKNFGKLKAVDRLDLRVNEGQVYGILGPNGSGKTTTLGMILDVIAPTSGAYEWFGGLDAVQSRKKIGSILEVPCFYPYLSAVDNLKITCHIKNADPSRIDQVLEQVHLHERKNDKFKTYSLGMKQRLSIAAALIADPPVMILDEPTNGLDPEGIAEVRSLIRDIARHGKTIILASHLLDEVQKVCTDFCILRKGKKLYEGRVSEILGETNQVELASADMDKLKKILKDYQGLSDIRYENGVFQAALTEGQTAADINQYCFNKGITLKRLITQTNSLEQEFLKILKEN